MKHNQKIRLITLAVSTILFCSQYAVAQTNAAINYTGNSANPYALLDLDATGHSKGLLIPRITASARTAMTFTVAAQGLMVYQTDGTQGFYYNASATTTPTWVRIGATPISLTSDITGVLPVVNGGTATSLSFTQGSVVFAGASGVYSQNNSNLFWDNSNSRLGIGTATGILEKLYVNGAIFSNSTATNTVYGGAGGDGANFVGSNRYWALRTNTANAFNLDVYNSGTPKAAITVLQNGSVGIGAISPALLLCNTSSAFSGGGATDGFLWKSTQNDYSAVIVGAPSSGAGYGLRTHTNGSTSSDYPFVVSSGASSGTIRFAVRGDGNVGIGTTSPGYKLEVRSTTAGPAAYIRTDATTGTNYGIDAEAMGSGATTNIGGYFAASGATSNYAIIVPSGYGNVGIGTLTPSSQLDIVSTANSSWATQILNTGTTGANGLYVNIGSGSTGVPFQVDKNGSILFRVANDGNLRFSGALMPNNTAGTSGQVLTSAGSGTVPTWTDPAGLGVRWNAITAPTGNASIAHGANTTSFTFNSLANNTNAFELTSTSTAGGEGISKMLNISRSGACSGSHQSYGIYSAVTCTGTGTGNIGGYFSASGATNNYAAIFYAGNVGIGTVIPGTKLHVAGNENANWLTTFENTGTNGHQVYMGYNNGTTRYGLYIAGGYTTSATYDLLVATNKFAVKGDGYVGVGTSAPAHLLELSADDAAKPGGGSWSSTSDIRLKKDTSAFTDGLSLIKKIKPINFKYNGLGGTPSDNQSYVGISAQEMQAIAPYTVKSCKKELIGDDAAKFPYSKAFLRNQLVPGGSGMDEVAVYAADILVFNPSSLVFILINSVKELDAENTNLKTELTDVKARLEKLEK